MSTQARGAEAKPGREVESATRLSASPRGELIVSKVEICKNYNYYYDLYRLDADGEASLYELEAAVGTRSVGNAVLREEAERPIEPCLGPPLPAETVTLAGSHQMVPNLLLDPVSNVREAPARMADGKVLHPATQNRVDLRNHLADWPGPKAAENLFELVQQRRPLLDARDA